MPNPPFNTSVDRTQLFRDSGAETLLALGRVLIDLALGMRSAPFRTPQPDGPVPGDVDDCVKAVVDFFGSHPRAKLRQLLLSGGSKEIDLRICRVIAALAAHHVLDGQTGVPALTLARICAAEAHPADILEWRRVIASCGVNGLIAVADQAGLFATVKLRDELLEEFLGGQECVPHLGDTIFAALREERRQNRAAPSRKSERQVAAQSCTDAASFVRNIP